MKFRVIGAHANRNFVDIEVEAIHGLAAFGAAALALKEAGEEGEAEFYAAIPSGTQYDLPGESVVSLKTVLDPEQADVFGLANNAVPPQGGAAVEGDALLSSNVFDIEAERAKFAAYITKRNPTGARSLLEPHPSNAHWYAYAWVNESWLAWLYRAEQRRVWLVRVGEE